MASSRLEKIGTIFSRVNGLLKSGAMKWEDRPLWYDIYKAFPPNDEPRYDRPAPAAPVRNIFYAEDKIRAKFHNEVKSLGTINMSNHKSQTKTQRFINIYNNLEKTENLSEEELFNNALEILNREAQNQQSSAEQFTKASSNLASSFKEAQQQSKVDVTNIFKE